MGGGGGDGICGRKCGGVGESAFMFLLLVVRAEGVLVAWALDIGRQGADGARRGHC